MHKTLIMALATAVLAASPVVAGDKGEGDHNNQMKNQQRMDTEGSMNPTAGQGAPSNMEPGTATSDRTPEKQTMTPPSQVDRSGSGETSDRTPEKHKY